MTIIATAPDQLHGYLVHAGVPPRFLDRRLDTFVERGGTRRALEAARAVADRPAGLLLVGPSGTGKTHLAVGILAERARRWLEKWPDDFTRADDGHGGFTLTPRPQLRQAFVGVPKLLDDLRYAIRRSDDDPLPRYATADLLVLDDLGRERTTDWALERLYVLVNERYEARRPTIVTANYRPADLAASGMDAVVSRLREHSTVVELRGSDYRTT